MSIAIIDSGGANIGSIRYALGRLGVEAQLTDQAAEIRRAERVILPGVGAAGAAMAKLRSAGLIPLIRELRQPVLGICLGLQLLFEASDEDDVQCLGVLPGRVRRLPRDKHLRLPHMGWNRVRPVREDALTTALSLPAWAYFVHSFAAPPGPWTTAVSEHGEAFTAMLQHDNIRACQFHPERSAATGREILQRFLEIPCPAPSA